MDLLHELLDDRDVPSASAFDRAMLAARRADRLADVFTAAYVGAVCTTFGVADARVALCVTEDGGNTPRNITTRFVSGRLHGTKSFVTFGDQADALLVLAVRGEPADDGHRDLVIARTSPGEVQIEELLETPFMPEIRHARVLLEGSAAQVVHEDAWPLVKAFRLVEDVFVLGSTLAWLFRLGADSGQAELATALAPQILAAQSIASLPPDSRTTHLAYDGLHRAATETMARFDWTAVGEQIAERWDRDSAALDVAATARSARGELARRWLSSLPDDPS